VEPNPEEVASSAAPSDEELAKLAQRGDIDSLNTLFSKHWSALQRRTQWLYPVAWDDLLQEGYLVVLTKFKEFGPPYNFRAWVAGILELKAKNFIKADATQIRFLGPQAGSQDIHGVWSRETAPRQVGPRPAAEAFGACLEPLDADSQKVGRHMLAFFAKDEKWPSKRAIERELCIPASTALRCREKVEQAWKRDCQA